MLPDGPVDVLPAIVVVSDVVSVAFPVIDCGTDFFKTKFWCWIRYW